MQDLTRALLFISLFAGVFIGTMVLENWWAKRRGVNKLYHFPETFTNMMTGLSYKVVDGIAIALFILDSAIGRRERGKNRHRSAMTRFPNTTRKHQ
jgi:hypothetical protein